MPLLTFDELQTQIQQLYHDKDFAGALDLATREADRVRMFPVIMLRPQERGQAGSPPCPLMVALHANATTAQASLNYWRPAAIAGWLVAMPQSSQALWKGAYVWDDLQVTKTEIQKHVDKLLEQYSVDPKRIILAGHSMGGEVALWLTPTNAIKACGFILIGPGSPYIDEKENWASFIRENSNDRLRGYIIVGEEDDTISHDRIETLVELLAQGGIPCEMEEIPHAGHDYAPEMGASLLRAIDFIVQD